MIQQNEYIAMHSVNQLPYWGWKFTSWWTGMEKEGHLTLSLPAVSLLQITPPDFFFPRMLSNDQIFAIHSFST